MIDHHPNEMVAEGILRTGRLSNRLDGVGERGDESKRR